MTKKPEAPLVERRRPQIEMDQFLAILSHALRNPVQAISTNAWLVKSRTTDAKLTGPAEAIERQVARLSQVLDDLVDVARLSRKTELALESVSVQAVVSAAVVDAQASADSHRRELTVDLAAETLLLQGDPKRLRQAIGNLLDNAIKYSAQQSEIVVSVVREGGQAVISIKDQGVGIAASQLTGIFENFTRLIARSKESEGVGLGLHMARELVEGHGGSVEAHSAGLGKGSEFIVRLPLDVSEIPQPPGPENSFAPHERLTILVVDDSRDAADSLAEVLIAQGHDARAAYGGKEALRLATHRAFDVALVDIGMPTVDGLEVARTISQLPNGAKTMLVAVTGWGAGADRERSKAAGFAYHLTKPIDYDTLGALLATAARSRAAALNAAV